MSSNDDPPAENAHEASFLSLLYNSTSNFLSNVVFIEGESPAENSLPQMQKQDSLKETEPRQSIFSETDLQGLEFLDSIEDEKAEVDSLYIPKKVGGEIEYSEPVLNHQMIVSLKPHLPMLVRESSELVMLFSIDRNGISMRTLFESCTNSGPCLIAVKDTNNQIFGCFINESLHSSNHYYGTGESYYN